MTDDQSEVVTFLSDPAAWHPPPERVGHVETHGAHVFLGTDRVLKIKRAVRYAYMDFSTLEKRRAVILREVELNRRFAPSLYLGAVAITRGADGRLAVGGSGEAVEWAVAMRRFGDDALLSRIARRGPLGAPLVKALAGEVLASHRAADVARGVDAAAAGRLVADVSRQLAEAADPGTRTPAQRFADLAAASQGRVAPLLARRSAHGHVRRCHGDLHLANIVLLDGQPTLFDALEFDEALATIDTLYDLAFLLMDLDVAGHRDEANLLLGHYLWLSGDDDDLDGLAALPLFLGLRAAIRAMVGLQRRQAVHDGGDSGSAPAPGAYLDRALGYLAPPPPRLVAVGGLSGTGKSTLAAALAPGFGAAPGAVHLRSDLERKRLHGAAETERLPSAAYTPGAGAAVYARLLARARLALAAGHSVIVDAVFQDREERQAAEDVARALGVPFDGLWLEADAATMLGRIERRLDDASDATADVLQAQLQRECGALTWQVVEAGRPPEAVCRDAQRRLGIAGAA